MNPLNWLAILLIMSYQRTLSKLFYRCGTTIRRIDEQPDGVRVHLSDGSTEVCDLLIGADGIHSNVRRLL